MKQILLVSIAALGLPVMCPGQSALNGTWKIDLKQVGWSEKPDIFLLAGGTYECKTCTPPIKVKADGSDQPVSGHPYYNTVAIEVVNDHELKETDKKNGQVVATSTASVSADGNSLSFEFSDSSNTNGGPPVTGKGMETRVAKGPAGSHAVSGSWRMSSMDNISDNGTAYTFQLNGDELTMTTPTGQSYKAKLDGTDSPVKGDPGVTSVSVRMIGKNTLEETYKRNGKPITVIKTVIDADGKTAHIVAVDKQQNRTTEYTSTKQ